MPITETDIKLEPVQVKMECYDLCLDCMDPERKKTDPAGMRRALVHDFDDGLTMNWAKDYPGGVTINTLKTIDAKPKMLTSPSAIHLTIYGNTKIADNLKVDNDVTIDGSLKLKGKFPPGGFAPAGWTPYYDLKDKIHELEARIAALEKK